MKRFSVLFAAVRAVVFCGIVFVANLSGHGFAARTLIKAAPGGWRHIDSIYGHPSSCEQYIASYDRKTKRCLRVKVKSAGESVSNCYVSMWLDSSPEGEIKCTPVQEFYLPEKNKWVSACKLKVGNKVLSFGKELKAITRIQFVKQPVTVYALHMKGIHNYMVGKYAVLTHNIALTIPYVAWASIGVAFGEGAVTGGTAGAYFGPLTCVVGAAALGVMFAGSVLFFGDNKRTRYQSHFHAGYFEDKFKNQEDEGQQEESYTQGGSSGSAAGGGGPPPPEDEDPRRASGRDSRKDSNSSDPSKKNVDKTLNHPKFGKFYRNKDTGHWWSRDRAGHGGSKWKVFQETGKGLSWLADADEVGNIIQGKHKGPTGRFISWKDLNG